MTMKKYENLVSNMVSHTTSNTALVSNKPELDTKKFCPRCEKKGCLCSRYVLNSRKRRYGLYFYFKHYDHGKVTWCYIGRKRPRIKLEDEH